MNLEVKKKWVDALRSGKFKQGRQALRQRTGDDGPDAYCCLGVLCELYQRETGQMGWEPTIFNTIPFDGHLSLLPSRVEGWAGGLGGTIPPESLPLAWQCVGNRAAASQLLIALNDGGSTFEEIADLIEKHL